jgi:hypothetical protein
VTETTTETVTVTETVVVVGTELSADEALNTTDLQQAHISAVARDEGS